MPRFFTEQELVSYCKERSLKLSASWNDGSGHLRTGSMDTETDANEKWQELQILVPLMEGTESGQLIEGVQTLGAQDRIWIPLKLWQTLSSQLNDETSEIRKLSSWPVDRTFVYLDISDFSQLSYGHQLITINSLIQLVQNEALWEGSQEKYPDHILWGRNSREAMICIGDGYIYAFSDPIDATLFAARLACLIEQAVAQHAMLSIHFRIGIHSGMVSFFWDAGAAQWNYSGEGVVGGRRVLDAVGKDVDDVIYVSDHLRSRIQTTKMELGDPAARERILSCLINRGRRSDKHGDAWRVYELNHTVISPTAIKLPRRL